MQTFSSSATSPRHIIRAVGVAGALIASLLTGAFVTAPAAAAAAEDAIDWEVDTVDGSFGSGRQNYSYAVEPGDLLEDAFVVVNNGSTPIDLVLYAADAFTTDAGQLDLRTRDYAPTGVGAWLGMVQEQISLEPGESGEIPFTITIPDDAAKGDHMGGIVTAPASTSIGTELERRAAIRVHLRVGDGFRPSLSVEDLNVGYSGEPFGAGQATVTYTLRNTGDIILAAEQSATVAGPFDTFHVTAAPVDAPRLLPGETWSVSVPVSGLAPAGLLTATIAVTPLYTDQAGSTGPLAAVELTGHGWAIPWVPLLLILCFGAVIGVLFARRRRRPASTSNPV